MRRLLASAACVIALGTACSSGGDKKPGYDATATTFPTTSTIPPAQLQPQASQIADLLIAGKYDDVVAHFNAEMLLSMSSQSLKTAWEQVTAEFGAYKSRGATSHNSSADAQGLLVFDTPMQFAKAAMKCRISFDADGKVAALRILAASAT